MQAASDTAAEYEATFMPSYAEPSPDPATAAGSTEAAAEQPAVPHHLKWAMAAPDEAPAPSMTCAGHCYS